VTWTFVWGMGVLLAGGLAGLLVWLARGSVPVATAWPIGLALGLPIISAAHGARVGWRWWWAKRTLSPLAQALGAPPQEEIDDDPEHFRIPVILAQALAGGVLAAWFALAGIATDWGWPTLFAGMLGGALGLGCEGALLGAALARRQPMPLPGAASGPSIASLASLLSWLWGQKHLARSWVLGYALDRAAPGAVAGTVVGVLVEVVDAVGGRIPVLIDGGVRRGTDVLKALGLGAAAVGIGRPYVWGLAAFGEAGVDRVLEIMDNEFTTIMRQVGALNINQITRDNVTRA